MTEGIQQLMDTLHRIELENIASYIEKYHWHDVLKDPYDLPTESSCGKKFLVKGIITDPFKNSHPNEEVYYISEYYGKDDCDAKSLYTFELPDDIWEFNEMGYVVAWREIDPYEADDE